MCQNVEMIQVFDNVDYLVDCEVLQASAPFIIQNWVACQAVRLGARGSAIFDNMECIVLVLQTDPDFGLKGCMVRKGVPVLLRVGKGQNNLQQLRLFLNKLES